MYECKTDLEDINGERFYYLWAHGSYIVYHWNRATKSLDRISSKIFININDARTYAREYSKIPDHKEQIALKIEALQEEIRQLEQGGAF